MIGGMGDKGTQDGNDRGGAKCFKRKRFKTQKNQKKKGLVQVLYHIL